MEKQIEEMTSERIKGYREALKEIDLECTRTEISITHIVSVANAALSKEEDKGEQPTNRLDELERWLKTYSTNSAFYTSDLLAKIKELKTITT